MRRKPSFSYCGLTVVLSNPSRFDKVSLLSATGGYYFNEKCLRPEFNIHQCDLRLASHTDPLLPGTKCVLLLGSTAAKQWLPHLENTLNEIRGSVYFVNNIPHVASYFPQDCADIVDYESQYNSEHDVIIEEDEDEYGTEKSRHGRTKRKNFGFWLLKDTQKCKYILKHGVPSEPAPNYIIYPSSQKVIELLTNTKNGNLYIDIETDKDLNILCFSFSFDLPNIFVVPCLLQDYSWAYSDLHKIYRVLAIAFRDNTTIAHNGSGFDFFVFAHKYRIPFGKNLYDTMLAQHRCYPEAEKSLGHCTSLWTWQPFHKDEGNVSYTSRENCSKIWQYCGKDVYTMMLIKAAIDNYAKKTPGIEESIALANRAIRPYLTSTIQGIKYDQEMLMKIVNENDRLCYQYLRMIELLIGKETLEKIRGKGKSSMPNSNLQCCRYFHEELGYPVISRGKEKDDGSRAPSLGKKAMFKLRLKYDNPVIDIILAYRETMKETSSLKFNPWKQ